MTDHKHYSALKLVEECAGIGTLSLDGERYAGVTYAIHRYQGMANSGLPIPGLHRVEGSIGLSDVPEAARRIGANFALQLSDGRVIGITLADSEGRVLTEGHGPSRCMCC
jgi:hypothetical protein